jgi:hypothetical protein
MSVIFIKIIIAHKREDNSSHPPLKLRGGVGGVNPLSPGGSVVRIYKLILFSIMITMYARHIDLGKFSEDGLDQIIHEGSEIMDVAKRVDFLSTQFLGIDYSESTLIGDKDTQEAFVINLREVDCLTFIEYIEAMRLSDSFSAFESNLRKVRYKYGIVEFANRNHFFTDWIGYNAEFVHNATEEIGGKNTVKVLKSLNEKEDGSYFLAGIQPVSRDIIYIPSDSIDDSVLANLGTGDYIGIYSALQGLDVSHVGIIIKKDNLLYLRHASSRQECRKVVDQNLRDYMANKPGLIILRPK